MLGIRACETVGLSYVDDLIAEYGILHKAQAYGILKRAGYSKAARNTYIKRRIKEKHFRELDGFLIEAGSLEITARQINLVRCLWVLMDYIDKIDAHYALYQETYIGFETEGRLYEITWVEPGGERELEQRLVRSRVEMVKKMNLALLQNYIAEAEAQAMENTQYIVVIASENQIPIICPDRILSLALVGDNGKIIYYPANSAGQEGE